MNKKGFSMIELMIVIAIITILAAILIPQFVGRAHGMDRNVPMVPTEEVLNDVASAVSDNPNQIVTILIYSATWSNDSAGYKQISAFLEERDRVMVALVRLGVPAMNMNILLANKGGREFTSQVIPAKDGVYIILE